MAEIQKFAANPLLAHAGAKPETQDFVEDLGVPRLYFFFGGMGEMGPKVREELAARGEKIEDGDPFLFYEGQVVKLSEDTRFLLFPAYSLQFWAQRKEVDKTLSAASLAVQRGPASRPGVTGWKENVLALLIILDPVEGALPIATVTTFEGAKCPFARGLRSAVLYSESKDWAKASPQNGAVIKSGAPTAFRVYAKMQLVPMVGKSGFSYVRALADCHTSGPDELKILSEWINTKECADQLQAAIDKFDFIREEITSLVA